MPRIIIEADATTGRAGRVTLAERLVPHHLQNDHYLAQLVERLQWALADAEDAASEELDEPLCPVHADPLAVLDQTGRVLDAHHSR